MSSRTRATGAALLSAASVALLLAAVAAAADHLARGAAAGVRIAPGSAAWTLGAAALLATADAAGRLSPGRRFLLAAALIGALAAAAAGGAFHALSIAAEYRADRAVFAAALRRHCLLVAVTVCAAAGAGIPLGIALHARPRLGAPVLTALNILQTVPSVALFGLLIPVLAALGQSGIGTLPAVLALTGYALLPAVRNTEAGLAAVPAAVREAAVALGFSRRRRFLAVELPLAVPAIVAGLRIMTVQTVGLAVIAALVGAGGLGDLVFGGIGQYAADLVLLGALPAVALAVAADALLGAAADYFAGRAT